jgi:hypothetical protein
MATAQDFRRVALSLHGTLEALHFDRAAFRVRGLATCCQRRIDAPI